jgi:2-methylcitrate dehydratase PrpD
MPESLKNQDIAILEDKVSLALDPDCASKFPKNRTAKVEIELLDGRIFKHHQVTRHGDPDDPLTDQELLDKFFELVAPRAGDSESQELARKILGSGSQGLKELTSIWGREFYV